MYNCLTGAAENNIQKSTKHYTKFQITKLLTVGSSMAAFQKPLKTSQPLPLSAAFLHLLLQLAEVPLPVTL